MSIVEVLSRADWIRLARWMHNGNGPHDFVMGIASDGTGGGYRRAKTVPLPRCLDSSWQAILRASTAPFCVAPYSSNAEGQSRWACIDIDGHDPQQEHCAGWLFKRILTHIQARIGSLQTRQIALIAEHSGRGFHIYLIARHFLPAAEWNRRIRALLNKVFPDIAVKRGTPEGIEIHPSKHSHGGCLGHAVRLPGTANVNTWNPASEQYEISLIVAHFGLRSLLASLPVTTQCNQRGLSSFSYTPEEPDPDKPTHKPLPLRRDLQRPLLELKEAKRLLQAHRIEAPATRHDRLLELVGEGFFNFGRKPLRQLAEHQFRDAPCPPRSSIDEHLAEFDEAYEGMLNMLPGRLNAAEQSVFSRLRPGAMRETFIIAQNFARHCAARRRFGADGRFALASPELGTRLGLSTSFADKLRRNLAAEGCIEIVQRGRPPNQANMYRWLLFEPPAE